MVLGFGSFCRTPKDFFIKKNICIYKLYNRQEQRYLAKSADLMYGDISQRDVSIIKIISVISSGYCHLTVLPSKNIYIYARWRAYRPTIRKYYFTRMRERKEKEGKYFSYSPLPVRYTLRDARKSPSASSPRLSDRISNKQTLLYVFYPGEDERSLALRAFRGPDVKRPLSLRTRAFIHDSGIPLNFARSPDANRVHDRIMNDRYPEFAEDAEEPSVTSLDPSERKLARRIRVQRRLEALTK